MATSAGSVSVSIIPSVASDFASDLRAQLTPILLTQGNQLGATFGKEIGDQVTDELRRSFANLPRLNLTSDTSAVTRDLDAIKARIDDLKKSKLTFTVKADTAKALSDIGKVEAAANRLDGRIVTIQLRVDADRARGVLDDLSRNRSADINVNINHSQISQVTNALGNIEGSASSAAKAVGEGGAGGGGLSGAMGGLGAIVGLSALPAIGGFIPILAGAGLAAGTLKVGMSGVGEAMALAGTDTKKYKEALDKMSPAQREFTKTLVSVKDQFHGLGPEIQKAMLPGFTAALKAAGPEIKAVRSSMVDMGKVFGDVGTQFGKMFKDSGFQSDFSSVLKMGTGSIREITSAISPFIASLIHFGAVSKPTLDVFTNGISGLLGKDLPGFFKGLESGINGSAAMFDGLFDALGFVLPALGRFSGAIADAFGPLLGSAFRTIGQLAGIIMDALDPAFHAMAPTLTSFGKTLEKLPGVLKPFIDTVGGELAAAVRNIGPYFTGTFTVLQEFGSVLGNLAVAVIPAFTGALGDVANGSGGFKNFADYINAHKNDIRGFFNSGADAAIDFVISVGTNLPTLFGVFDTLSRTVLSTMGTIVNGAAKAFGWVPGLGGKLKGAAEGFNAFRGVAEQALDAAKVKINDFSTNVVPRLENNKLKMDINNWNSQINLAKAQMKTVPPSKQAKLTADIINWQQKMAQAKVQIQTTPAAKKAVLTAQITNWQSQIGTASAQLRNAPSSKRAVLTAQIGQLQSAVATAKSALAGIHDKYVTIHVKAAGGRDSVLSGSYGFANGGIIQKYAAGGVLPGYTPGKDIHFGPGPSLNSMVGLSGGEAIMRPEWTRAVGVGYVNKMNAIARHGGVQEVRRVVGADGFHTGGVLPQSRMSQSIKQQGYATGGILPSASPVRRDIESMVSLASSVSGRVAVQNTIGTQNIGDRYVTINTGLSDIPTKDAVLLGLDQHDLLNRSAIL